MPPPQKQNTQVLQDISKERFKEELKRDLQKIDFEPDLAM